MTDTLSPPTPLSPTSPAPVPSRRSSAKTISIVAITLGGVLLAGTVGFVALGAIRASQPVTSITYAASLQGVTDLDIDVSATEFTVQYGDVAEATLDVTRTRDPQGWELTVDGDTLVVGSHDGWWLGGWNDDFDSAVLTLPRGTTLDADLGLSAGSFTALASFGELDVDVSAGAMRVEGDARSFEASLSAGKIDFSLANTAEAAVSASAGSISGELTGTALTSLELDVSAGDIRVIVPDEAYRVNSSVEAGDADIHVREDPNAARTISSQVSAGRVVVTPAS